MASMAFDIFWMALTPVSFWLMCRDLPEDVNCDFQPPGVYGEDGIRIVGLCDYGHVGPVPVLQRILRPDSPLQLSHHTGNLDIALVSRL